MALLKHMDKKEKRKFAIDMMCATALFTTMLCMIPDARTVEYDSSNVSAQVVSMDKYVVPAHKEKVGRRLTIAKPDTMTYKVTLQHGDIVEEIESEELYNRAIAGDTEVPVELVKGTVNEGESFEYKMVYENQAN